MIFEHTHTIVTKLYSDFRDSVFSVAFRVLKPQAIAERSRPGMLKFYEVEILSTAFDTASNILPIAKVNLNDSFRQMAQNLKVTENELLPVNQKCADFLLKLGQQLCQRIPSNIKEIEKIKYLTTRMTLTRDARPNLYQLPLELIDLVMDKDTLESQWILLYQYSLPKICPHSEHNQNVDIIDTTHFCSCVLNYKNSIGERPLKDIASFAIRTPYSSCKQCRC